MPISSSEVFTIRKELPDMNLPSLDFLSKETIGIIGCGHLGRTLAAELVARGFSHDQLRVSHGKSASSRESIIAAGLGECLAENDEICRDSSLIFISIRTQSLEEIKGLSFRND
ncbi:Pyrroline-5-carboxylate reductase [uncultured archaeon]|nr:Pyrroline-5-carboxylate reductase [uncultured archaeon]